LLPEQLATTPSTAEAKPMLAITAPRPNELRAILDLLKAIPYYTCESLARRTTKVQASRSKRRRRSEVNGG
jgi:hypothetical protein